MPILRKDEKKNILRAEFKAKRAVVRDKKNSAHIICEHVIMHDIYKYARTVLLYMAKEGEVNTDDILEHAFYYGKKVFVPKSEENHTLSFWQIKSNDDLIKGKFGIKEPDIKKCKRLTEFNKALCIVPALSFDKKGYRLGYGGGYYDTFLKDFKGDTMGLCFEECISNELPLEDFDIKVSCVVTQQGVKGVE